MADDGSGNFTLPSAPFVAGTTAVAADVNANFSDIATALTARVTRNGSGSMSGNLAMGTNKVTGLGAGTARTDAAQVAQLQDGGAIWGGTAGGTADALTLTLSPAITAYAAGQVFRFVSSAANTGAATINVNSVGAKNIRKGTGATALDAGDIPNGALIEVTYDGTQFVLTNAARTEAQARDAIGAAPLAAPAFTGDGSIAGGFTVSGAGGLSVVNGASVGTTLAVTGVATFTARPVHAGTGLGVNRGTAQATTSGTSIDFTSIPANVRRLVIVFSGVSTSGTDNVLVRLGTSGGLETTGYVSTSAALPNGLTASTASSTVGFNLRGGAGTDVRAGTLTLYNLSGDIWVAAWTVATATTNITVGAGTIELPDTLDRVSITTSGGTDTFDAGTINITWEV